MSPTSAKASAPVADLVTYTAEELAALAAELETQPASAAIAWAVDTFGDGLLLASSFQDAVLIDLAVKVKPDVEVLFIDTLDHFPETYETVERVRARYDLNLIWYRVPEPDVPFHVLDPIACCSDAKVAALEDALSSKQAWITGLRRVDAPTRAAAPVVGFDRRGLVKVNPLAAWTDLDLSSYIADHGIIYNPLIDQGYLSIGCAPTTRPVAPGDDPRSGRWTGSDKTECGLHE